MSTIDLGRVVGIDGPNNNLIDNWCFIGSPFPINQREAVSYSGAVQYTIDRWKTSNKNTTVTVGSNYLQISGSTGNTPYLLQQLNDFSLLWGQRVTLSILTLDSSNQLVLNTRTATLPSSMPSSSSTYCTMSEIGHILLVNNTIYVRLAAASGGSNKFVAVKLELGDFQTLAYSDSNGWHLLSFPNYQQELAKCQQYLVEITGPVHVAYSYCGIGEAISSSSATVSCTLPVTLRQAAASVTKIGSFALANSTASPTVTDITIVRTSGNTVLLTVTVASGLTTGQWYRLRANNDLSARLLISAES